MRRFITEGYGLRGGGLGQLDLSTAMTLAKWAAIGLGAWWVLSQMRRGR